MKFEIPAPLREEHDELHAELEEATRAPGAVGEAAREVARLMHPHFMREEEFALPPLGLLAGVVRGARRAEMREAIAMARRLKAELPAMFAEHRQIVAALAKLRAAARDARLPQYERFAHALVRHAETEELVLYPAAVLLGEHLARVLEEEPVL
ncbi:MAG TPA: hemerythrin domain-containing protein [Burkholderiales bacterium]|nr:hemerythrin domain-containing protein [Burkholderiales bacterium]